VKFRKKKNVKVKGRILEIWKEKRERGEARGVRESNKEKEYILQCLHV
jgi:hypothetical protein